MMKEDISLWDHLGQRLEAWRITADGKSYLLLQLDTAVEKEINEAWTLSPSRGWRLHCLAREMLLAACRECVPEIASTGCAPLPRLGPQLRAALAKTGSPPREDNTLSRCFALLTHFPFQGLCDLCALSPQCPGPWKKHAPL